jgi:hypothetical protein
MFDTKAPQVRPTPDHHTPSHPSILQPLLQSLLATLANLDFEYGQERERVVRSSPDMNVRIRALEKLKAQHRERREPYIQQLAILQGAIERLLN